MKISLTILLSLFTLTLTGQEIKLIDSIAKAEMKAKNIPAIAIGVIQNGKLTHLKAYGYSDMEAKTMATINTPFEVASVSKTVVNLAIFKLVALGKINVDKDVNRYLPFKVKNPHLPKEKITVAELLNHHSGLIDNYEILDADNNETKGDSDVNLSVYIESYFSAKGKLYSKDNFQKNKEYRYCNTAYALLGLIVENVSGTTFEDFCKKKYLSTAWND
jgi:CubicO group peptidase (beta-lactamase class C family)